MGDLERLAGRVGARTAGPRDLAGLAAALERVGAAGAPSPPRRRRARRAGGGARSAARARRDDRRCARRRPAGDHPHPGFIRPGHHPEIDELRGIARDGKGWLARFEAEERQRTGIASLKVRYNRVFGYYVEVTKPNLPLVPSDYERKQTLVGAERFVTPALKEHEAKVLGAEERLRTLEAHCFAELLEGVAAHQLTLARTADALGRRSTR